MAHTTGYQLVEDDFTSELLQLYPDMHVASALMSWVVERLRCEPVLAGYPIKIELVVAQYLGKYPCLAVQYLNTQVADVEPLVLSLLADYHARSPMTEWQRSAAFQRFLRSHRESVRAFCQRFDAA